MRFFDRDFVSAKLDDSEWEGRIQAYEQRKASIWPRLPPDVRTAIETIPFHDARIERLMARPGLEVQLQLFCDSSLGKSRVTLHFRGASLDAIDLDADAVLIESEVDELESGHFELRFIFKP